MLSRSRVTTKKEMCKKARQIARVSAARKQEQLIKKPATLKIGRYEQVGASRLRT